MQGYFLLLHERFYDLGDFRDHKPPADADKGLSETYQGQGIALLDPHLAAYLCLDRQLSASPTCTTAGPLPLSVFPISAPLVVSEIVILLYIRWEPLSRSPEHALAGSKEGTVPHDVAWGRKATGTLTITYPYDAVGNGRTMDSAEGSANCTHDGAKRVTNEGSVLYTWDNNGYPLSDGERSYTCDHAHRLTPVASGTLITRYGYNGDGARISKKMHRATLRYPPDLGTHCRWR